MAKDNSKPRISIYQVIAKPLQIALSFSVWIISIFLVMAALLGAVSKNNPQILLTVFLFILVIICFTAAAHAFEAQGRYKYSILVCVLFFLILGFLILGGFIYTHQT